MPRRRSRRLLLVLASTLLALVAAEWTYRLTRVSALSPTTHPAYVQHDEELGWSYRPSTRARHHSPEFDVEVRINAQGFRGPDWPAARDARPLVFVVGDSIAFGWGVEEPESLPGLLRAQHPEWDVRGVGISGFAPDQQLLLLRRLRRQFTPDVAVCVSCLNDVYEAAGNVAYGLRKPQFTLDGDGVRLLSTPGRENWLHAHSLLWRAVTKLIWRWQFQRQPLADDWSLVRALYRTMCRDFADTQFVLVSALDRLRPLAEGEHAMRYIDVGEVLPAGGAWIFPVDTHWNAAGHARVAQAVAAEVAIALATRGR
ncbi:MAG: GDSL-type esterase/lipase family protein [Planctomycetota bacterium]